MNKRWYSTPEDIIGQESGSREGVGRLYERLNFLFNVLSSLIYLLAAMAMVVISVVLIASSLVEIRQAVSTFPIDRPILLDSVSLVIISIAIIDVAKYIVEEEILRNRQLRELREARAAITKFMVIVTLVIALEGIVFIFDLGKTSPENLIYPVMLLTLSVFMIIGLGIFQRLTHNADNGGKS